MKKGIKEPIPVHIIDIQEIKERIILKTSDWEFKIIGRAENSYEVFCKYKDFDEEVSFKSYFDSYEEAHKYAVYFIYRRYE